MRWPGELLRVRGREDAHRVVDDDYRSWGPRRICAVSAASSELAFASEASDQQFFDVNLGGTFNLLHSVFHEWIGIARDVWAAPWRHKLGYCWRPPGWSHDDSRDTSDAIRERWLRLHAAPQDQVAAE